MERAKVLFGSYRRGDANDPDMYVASIAAVLACYEPELIRRVTDPRIGISTHEKYRTFMPNSGELKAYCDEHANLMARIRHYAALPPLTPQREPSPLAPLANVFVPANNKRYPEMIERARTGDVREFRFVANGIWVSMQWINRE